MRVISVLIGWTVRLGAGLRNAMAIHTNRKAVQIRPHKMLNKRTTYRMRKDLACRSDCLSLPPRGKDRRLLRTITFCLIYNAKVLPSRQMETLRLWDATGIPDTTLVKTIWILAVAEPVEAILLIQQYPNKFIVQFFVVNQECR